MKGTKLLLSTLAFVLAFSGNAFGQTEVEASAEVIAQINTSNVTNVDFGNIDPDLAPVPTLNPDDPTNNEGTDGSGQMGNFLVAHADKAVTMTFNNTTLEETDGNGNVVSSDVDILDYSVEVAVESGDATTSSGSPTAGNTTSKSSGENINTGGNNQTTIWIGGTLSQNSDPEGNGLDAAIYQGTVEFTLDYSL